MNDIVEKFWQGFLNDTGRPSDTRYADCFHFEITEYWANKLLDLVMSGQKRATSSSLYAYEIEGDKLPEVGELSIVTDWDGVPKCVIETKQVNILPVKDITFDICKREGEDECLETWQKGHISFFTEDGRELGYEFTPDMPVVFEDFEVIYKK